ncbi:large tegument protein [Ateline alphaherpesvirus 1]|uniref:Large tegument protein n=1 Tax=Herpesvirus ateles type 1 (strain Lennette) TaxID=35243 RepID=A0A1S6JLM0_HSVA1|nr:large tegument protein [Ateline alphaherpesvirus 1]AQS79179.1 large tegument protein [Ateline alphaherpesvirus 1]
MGSGGDRAIVATGFRNQFAVDLEPGGSVSCMRSSLSFLSLVYDGGLWGALSAEAVDGCLEEGVAWTRAQAEAAGGPPRTCAAVELPNFLVYPGGGGVRCVFSRVYGDVGFYARPHPALLPTQCSAYEFFAAVWDLRPESYTIATVGVLGVGIYRYGDDVYVFDPHGRGDVPQASVVKIRAGDAYAYLSEYTRGRSDVMWAAVMVFFVPSGPAPVADGELALAVLQLYGATEIYLLDEPFRERRALASHPLRGGAPPAAAVAVGAAAPKRVAAAIEAAAVPAKKKTRRDAAVAPARRPPFGPAPEARPAPAVTAGAVGTAPALPRLGAPEEGADASAGEEMLEEGELPDEEAPPAASSPPGKAGGGPELEEGELPEEDERDGELEEGELPDEEEEGELADGEEEGEIVEEDGELLEDEWGMSGDRADAEGADARGRGEAGRATAAPAAKEIATTTDDEDDRAPPPPPTPGPGTRWARSARLSKRRRAAYTPPSSQEDLTGGGPSRPRPKRQLRQAPPEAPDDRAALPPANWGEILDAIPDEGPRRPVPGPEGGWGGVLERISEDPSGSPAPPTDTAATPSAPSSPADDGTSESEPRAAADAELASASGESGESDVDFGSDVDSEFDTDSEFDVDGEFDDETSPRGAAEAPGSRAPEPSSADGDAAAVPATPTSAARAALEARARLRPPPEDAVAPAEAAAALTLRPETAALLELMATRQAAVSREVRECEGVVICALRSPHPSGLGPLEYAIEFMFERILAFLVENGVRTHAGVRAGPADGLLDATLRALPAPTAVGDFLASTRLALAEAPAHLPLAGAVLTEGSHAGRLALAKLVLVAREAERATDELHDELDALERQLRSAARPDAYAWLSERFLELARARPEALFAPATALRPEPLLQRVERMARLARAEELRAEAEALAVHRALAALQGGVEAAALRGGPLAPTTAPPPTGGQPPAPLAPEAALARLAEVRAGALRAVEKATRDYFTRGCVYSARALLANKKNDRRFHVAAAAVEPAAQLLASLPAFDGRLSEAAAGAGVSGFPPAPLATSPQALLLAGLVRAGGDLETEEKLAAWLALLREAQGEGRLERRELEELARDVAKINERALRHRSGAAELARFEALSAAVDQALEDEAAFRGGGGPGGPRADTVLRMTEDALRQARFLAASRLLDDADPAARERVAGRAAELERLQREALERAELERRARDAFYQKLRGVLRPLPRFEGLRAAPAVLHTLETSALPVGVETLAAAARDAPPEAAAALRADLWTLLEQYRAALERPDADTAATLAGIAAAFGAVLEAAFAHLPERAPLSRFFADHAGAVARALSEAAAATGAAPAVADPAGAVAAARRAADALAAAAADLGQAASDPASPLGFLSALAARAQRHARATETAARARERAAALAAAGAELAAHAVRVRRAGPADADPPPDRAVAAARAEARTARAALAAAEGEFGGLLHPDGAAGEASVDGRALKELAKTIEATRRRCDELEAAADELEARAAEDAARNSGERWTRDVERALDLAETRAAFDAAELRRLRALAHRHGYDPRAFRERAERALATNAQTVTAALDAALAFNPYTPENQRHPALPPLAALHRVAWGDAFGAAAEPYAEMFGVDVEPLLRLLRLAAGVLEAAAAGEGFPDYQATVARLADDLAAVPALARYVPFFLRGHAEYLDARDALDALRARVRAAAGGVGPDLDRAAAAALRALRRRAAEALRLGVTLSCPGEDALADAVSQLERLDQTPLRGTAYAEYVAFAARRDLGEAKDALVRARQQRARATEAVSAALREAAAAQERGRRSAEEGLAGLKAMLRAVATPPAIARALEQARSAAEAADQIGALVDQTERRRELDAAAVEWLEHARAVFETHPAAAPEGGGGSPPGAAAAGGGGDDLDALGPLALHAPRIDALIALGRRTAALRRSLEEAEAEWDEAWGRFERARGEAFRSPAGLREGLARLLALRTAANTVLGLRADEDCARLPPKLTGALDARLADRARAMEDFGAAAERHERLVGQLHAEVADRVPWEMAADPLRRMLAAFDATAKALPTWAVAEFRAARELIAHRLGLYNAHARCRSAADAGAAAPALLPADALALEARARSGSPAGPGAAGPGAAGPGAGGPGDAGAGDPGLLGARAAAFARGDAAAGASAAGPLALREATSRLDGPFPVCYLTPDGAPLQYALCYRAATDKLGVAVSRPEAARLRPPLPAANVEAESTLMAGRVLSLVNELRLGAADALASDFRAFDRFLRGGDPEWPSASAAAAELYAAQVATTWTREHGCRWGELGIPAGAAAVERLRGPPEDGRPPVSFTVDDVMIALVCGCPGHVFTFWRLDLVRQHEYMALTLAAAAAASLRAALFVQRLTPHADPAARVLPTRAAPPADAAGGLFATRAKDWRAGQLSPTDPLAPWRRALETAPAAAPLVRLTPRQALAAVGVLGRMCLPGDALGALWTCMIPDALAECPGLDALLARRFAGAALRPAGAAAVPGPAGDDRDDGAAAAPPLYVATGRQVVLPAAPADAEAERVTAMDLVLAATLLGAPVVVALRHDLAFSRESELDLCLTLFDSRDGGPDAGLRRAVSADVESWAVPLLRLDPNPIENACLAAQLPELARLLADRPLREADPCLVMVNLSLAPVSVLWQRADPPGAPTVRFVGPEAVDELRYVDARAAGVEPAFPAPDPADPLYSRPVLGQPFRLAMMEGDAFPGVPVRLRAGNQFPHAVAEDARGPLPAAAPSPLLDDQAGCASATPSVQSWILGTEELTPADNPLSSDDEGVLVPLPDSPRASVPPPAGADVPLPPSPPLESPARGAGARRLRHRRNHTPRLPGRRPHQTVTAPSQTRPDSAAAPVSPAAPAAPPNTPAEARPSAPATKATAGALPRHPPSVRTATPGVAVSAPPPFAIAAARHPPPGPATQRPRHRTLHRPYAAQRVARVPAAVVAPAAHLRSLTDLTAEEDTGVPVVWSAVSPPKPTVPPAQPAAPLTLEPAPTAQPAVPSAQPAAPLTLEPAPTAQPAVPSAQPAAPLTLEPAPTAQPAVPSAQPAAPPPHDPPGGQAEITALVRPVSGVAVDPGSWGHRRRPQVRSKHKTTEPPNPTTAQSKARRHPLAPSVPSLAVPNTPGDARTQHVTPPPLATIATFASVHPPGATAAPTTASSPTTGSTQTQTAASPRRPNDDAHRDPPPVARPLAAGPTSPEPAHPTTTPAASSPPAGSATVPNMAPNPPSAPPPTFPRSGAAAEPAAPKPAPAAASPPAPTPTVASSRPTPAPWAAPSPPVAAPPAAQRSALSTVGVQASVSRAPTLPAFPDPPSPTSTLATARPPAAPAPVLPELARPAPVPPPPGPVPLELAQSLATEIGRPPVAASAPPRPQTAPRNQPPPATPPTERSAVPRGSVRPPSVAGAPTSWNSLADLRKRDRPVSWNQTLLPRHITEETTDDDSSDLSDSDGPDGDLDDERPRPRTPEAAPFGPPPIPANSVLTRRYVRSTGRSALAALLEICLRVRAQLSLARRVLARQSEAVLLSLHHIRMLLG